MGDITWGPNLSRCQHTFDALQITFPWVICRAQGHVDASCPVRCSNTDAHTPNLLASLSPVSRQGGQTWKRSPTQEVEPYEQRGSRRWFRHSYSLDSPLNKAINAAISNTECAQPTKGGSLSTYRLNWCSHKATCLGQGLLATPFAKQTNNLSVHLMAALHSTKHANIQTCKVNANLASLSSAQETKWIHLYKHRP